MAMRGGSIQQRHSRSCPRDANGALRPHKCKGNWGYVLEQTPRADGSRRQTSKSGFASKREAQAALDEELAREKSGIADIRGLTVATYLDQWLAGKRGLRPTTRRNYAGHLERYIIPGLGGVALRDLRPHHIDLLYDEMLSGKLGTATAATVHHVHRTLRSALNTAVKRRMISWSPAEHVELPRRARPRTTVWAPEDVARFLEASEDDRYGALFRVILFTGLRRGEALGLHWSHVDLERRHLIIEMQVVDAGRGPELGEPKTRSGRRIVPIDQSTAELLDRLKASQQAHRASWGETWDPAGLVFSRPDGGLLRPDNVTAAFTRAVHRAGLPRIRLHDLRHTHASLALAAGVEMKVVSDRLGHSTTSITADLYTHVIPKVAREAADRIAASMQPQRPDA
jgi:integrase